MKNCLEVHLVFLPPALVVLKGWSVDPWGSIRIFPMVFKAKLIFLVKLRLCFWLFSGIGICPDDAQAVAARLLVLWCETALGQPWGGIHLRVLVGITKNSSAQQCPQ